MALLDVTTLSTEDLDLLTKLIALERAKREPVITMEQPQTMEAALDPKWYVSLTDANTFLQLRHPGHGWVGYLIPPASRAQLVSMLMQHALLPPMKQSAQPIVTSGGGTVH